MSDAIKSSPDFLKARSKRFQFSIRSLIRWQLLILPVFLSPLYFTYGGPPPGSPVIRLAAMVVAPLGYVAVLLLWTMASGPQESVVRTVWCGTKYGVLFAVLASLTLIAFCVISAVDQALGAPRLLASIVPQLLENFGMIGLTVLSIAGVNGLLGAAAGGLIGLCQSASRCRSDLVSQEQI